MKEYYLNMHSEFCPSNKSKNKAEHSYLDNYCDLNPERFLFYLGVDFYLITFHNCIAYKNDYDFKVDLISKIIDKYKIFELYKVNKSVDVDADLKNFRIRNRQLRKNIKQVNYIYKGYCKEYAITTTVNYIDSICNNDTLKRNYNIAREYILKNEYLWLLPELEKLYLHNIITEPEEVEYCRTIEHLISLINNKT